MNEFRKDWIFIFPIITVVIAIIATICHIPYGIDTLYDEGSHCLDMLSSLNDNIPGDDRTWWSDIFLAVLGRDICSSVISLRIVRLCIAILTSITFWLLTKDVARGRVEKLAYLSVILLLSIPTMGSIIVSYNSFSQFLFVVGCGVLYRLTKTENSTYRALYAFVLGILLTFSLFAIIVSGVVVSAAMLFMIVYRYWKSWKHILVIFGSMFAGCVLTLLWIHMFAVPLQQVWHDIMDIGQSITKVNRGYDPISMAVKMVLFLRDMSLCVVTLLGINYISQKLLGRLGKWMSGIAYVVLFLLYAHYQTKPIVTIVMLSVAFVIQAYWSKYNSLNKPIEWKQLFKYDNVFNLFILVFPLLAVLGTVVYIGDKMMWFIIPWALLAWRLGFGEKECSFRLETLLVMSLLYTMPYISTIRSINPSEPIVERGAFKGMHLNDLQAAHFEEVDSILSQYDYKPGKSVFFATQLSMASMCYLEAIPCGFYFEPMDFIAHVDENTPIPDYVFMNDFDLTIASEKMQQVGWGWPDEFDKYYVGSPDVINVGYRTDRWLYCRKNKKVVK